MREVYSILWFLVGIGFIMIAVWEYFLIKLTVLIGAKYPASVLFFFGIIFVLILLIHFSVEISTLRKQNNAINQSLSILNNKVEKLAKSITNKNT